MQKVLVTGGAGFIGSHTVDLLLAKNIPVRVLDNFSSGHRANLPNDHALLEIIEGDITDYATVEATLTGVSHCLHLAAQVSVIASLQEPSFSASNNIVGYVNVLSAAQRLGVQRLVYASSAAVYGEPASIPLSEDDAKLQLSPYGLEKQVNEYYADLYQRLYQLSSLGLRFFNVYGPRQDPKSPYAGVIAKFVDCIQQGETINVFGDGQQSRDFIYVKDVAGAIVKALESDLEGACNIGTSVQTSLLQLIDSLKTITAKDCEVVHGAAMEGDIRHSLAEVSKMNQRLGITAKTNIESGLIELLATTSD